MTHPAKHDLSAYALGAVTPEEEREIAAHAAKCEPCAVELRQLGAAVGALAGSVPQQEPPATLRENLMKTVRAEAATDPAVAKTPWRERAGDWLRGSLLRPATAAVAVAILIAGAAGYALREDGGGSPSTEIPVTANVSGAGGSVLIESDAATLRVHGMAPLENGAVYQVWIANGASRTPSAAFVPHDDGTATVAVPEAAGDADQVMVTREPRIGRKVPTLPTLLTASLDDSDSSDPGHSA